MMNSDDPTMPGEPTPETHVVAGLIRSAGRRAEPPAASYQRTLAVATDAWRAKTAGVRRRRIVWTMSGLAAGVSLLVVLLPLVMRTDDAPRAPVARLQQVSGRLEVRMPGASEWHPAGIDGTTLPANSRVRTGPGSRASLTLAGGSSLRLAEGTEVALDGTTRLSLVAGRAYVDSGAEGRPALPLEIVTPTATARELGTQFEVALVGQAACRVRVREGAVVLDDGEHQVEAAAGEQLLLAPGRQLVRSSILRTDPEWQWVQTVAPVPDLNDRPVSELLQWVERETGRDVRYADSEVARRAATTILHGNVRNLLPLEVLDVMLATTEFEYVAQPDGTLLIQAKPED